MPVLVNRCVTRGLPTDFHSTHTYNLRSESKIRKFIIDMFHLINMFNIKIRVRDLGLTEVKLRTEMVNKPLAGTCLTHSSDMEKETETLYP